MKIGTLVASLALGGLAVFIGQMDATALPQDGGEGGVSAGPDVIVGSIPDVARYTPGTFNGVEYAAYAIGTTSCNIGTTQLQWQPMPSTLHPTIPQNMYRYANGRFEQIGMSWIKHGFCALQQTLCGTCIPAGSGCPTVLGIGCSDPYTASLNGDQADLKSRRGVNASTGVFASNYTDPTAEASEPTAIRERLRVRRSDLNSTSNSLRGNIRIPMTQQPGMTTTTVRTARSSSAQLGAQRRATRSPIPATQFFSSLQSMLGKRFRLM
jgi:hypothetical protein